MSDAIHNFKPRGVLAGALEFTTDEVETLAKLRAAVDAATTNEEWGRAWSAKIAHEWAMCRRARRCCNCHKGVKRGARFCRECRR